MVVVVKVGMGSRYVHMMMKDLSQTKFFGKVDGQFFTLKIYPYLKHKKKKKKTNEHTFESVFASQQWNDEKLFCRAYFSMRNSAINIIRSRPR